MSKVFSYVSSSLILLSCQLACADDFSMPERALTEIPLSAKPMEAPFKPFTGKIRGKKIRLRTQADLEGHVVRELNKNELISIVGEKNEFWAVEPPAGIKAYVFRSFILDNVVEGNRVNVRLHPDLEAPIIGHLNSGEHIDGIVSALNSKWYEITVPSTSRFYVAKEYIENCGGPEVKARLDKRKQSVEQMLDAAVLLSKAELRKPFEEIDINRLSRNFKTVIEDYEDFPDHVEQAKDALTTLQESYLEKKIAFLEEKTSLPLAALEKEEEEVVAEVAKAMDEPTERMKMWEPIEESLYLTWGRINEERSLQEFYDEQALSAVALTGILEPYASPVKNKPGDFILRNKDLPVAYLYSTTHNLQSFVGKKVRVIATPRNNNNFAFPAYFVLTLE